MRKLLLVLAAAPLLAGTGFAVGVGISSSPASAGVHPEPVRPLAELEAIAEGHVARLEKTDSVKSAVGFYGQALAAALAAPAREPLGARATRFADASRCAFVVMSPRVADPILDDMRRDMVTTRAERAAYLRLVAETSTIPSARPEDMPCML